MDTVFELGDALGPYKTIHVFNPRFNVRGILVIDNVAIGPAIGGLRMAKDVSLEECARLARAMTFKNAAAGLAHGGGKSVLIADPAMPIDQKEAVIRAFARALHAEEQYIFGPDMGTNETSMAWVRDEIGRSVGLPKALGGIPLDELGATGWGVAAAAEVAQDFCDVKLAGATMAIQGFGAVGMHSARFLTNAGVTLVAAADSKGTVYSPEGLDVEALIALKHEGRSVMDYSHGQKSGPEDIVGVQADIWIPAARPDVIRMDNVASLKTRLIIQGANIPMTADAEKAVHEAGILNIPDFIANAGGVICAAMEYQGMDQAMAFDTIKRKVAENTRTVLGRAEKDHSLPRQAAISLANERLEAAMNTRRWGLY